MMEKKRFDFVDGMKGIGIILVVLGHVSMIQPLNRVIYAFHMPLFFFASGFLFFFSRKEDFIQRKIKAVLTPYFVFSVLTFLYWALLERTMRGQTDIPLLSPFLNIFVAQGGDDGYVFNVVLWFLPCLLVTQLAFYFADKYIKNKLILAVFVTALSAAGYVYSLFSPFRLPWCLDSMAMVMPFYALGYGFASLKNAGRIKTFSNVKTALLALAAAAVLLALSFCNGRVDINGNIYGNYFLFYLAALAGIALVYLLCSLKTLKWLAYLGAASLVIMCVHEPAKRVLIQVAAIASGVSADLLRENIFFVLASGAVLLLLCVPVYYLINRFVPCLIGRPKRKPD